MPDPSTSEGGGEGLHLPLCTVGTKSLNIFIQTRFTTRKFSQSHFSNLRHPLWMQFITHSVYVSAYKIENCVINVLFKPIEKIIWILSHVIEYMQLESDTRIYADVGGRTATSSPMDNKKLH